MEKYKTNREFQKEADILGELGVPAEDIEFLKFQRHKEENAERWRN